MKIKFSETAFKQYLEWQTDGQINVDIEDDTKDNN